MITCIICRLEKEMSDYYSHKGNSDGVLHKCKECCKSYARSNRSREADANRYTKPRRKLYCIRNGMKGRCYNPNNSRYYRYGLRGITIEWNTFQEFYDDMCSSFVEHMDKNPSSHKRTDTTIDRINVDGNYCKSNCRWATYKQQANNK